MSDPTAPLESVVPDDVASNTRLNKWLLKHYRHVFMSKENTRKSILRKEISVNGCVAEEAHVLYPGDLVQIRYDKSEEERERLKGMTVDVQYEDEHLAVVWKPPGESFAPFEKAISYSLDFATPAEESEPARAHCAYSLPKAASGLFVVSKTKAAREALIRMGNSGHMLLRMRVICHGRVPADALDSLMDAPVMRGKQGHDAEDHEIVDTMRKVGDMVKQIELISVTRSNNAEYLSTLDLHLAAPLSSLSIRSLFFHQIGHPILGGSLYTKYLKTGREKGLYMSLLGVSFPHPFVPNKRVIVDVNEPDKFKQTRMREQVFWQRKVDQALEEMRKAGVQADADTDAVDTTEQRHKKPLAYLLGEKEFYQLRFKVTEACLVPRPSSETLVSAAISYISTLSRDARILDVGTGCGNLLLSILHHAPSTVTGVGIDISEDALAVAGENARRILGNDSTRATFVLQDMAQMATSSPLYDVIVCNPPYLNIEKKSILHEFEHEPSVALFADQQGYAWYSVLSKVAPCLIHSQGQVVLECGKGMMEHVKLIWSGWKVVKICKDKQGWDRCLVLEMN